MDNERLEVAKAAEQLASISVKLIYQEKDGDLVEALMFWPGNS